jgi:hypothetical protein
MCLQVTDSHLPSEASIELPKVHVSAEYVQDGNNPREAQFAGVRNCHSLLYFSVKAYKLYLHEQQLHSLYFHRSGACQLCKL